MLHVNNHNATTTNWSVTSIEYINWIYEFITFLILSFFSTSPSPTKLVPKAFSFILFIAQFVVSFIPSFLFLLIAQSHESLLQLLGFLACNSIHYELISMQYFNFHLLHLFQYFFYYCNSISC